MKNNRTIGSRYEDLAAAFLKDQGYEILERNFYCNRGEIDLIAKDGEYIVFVEVKYRKSDKNGHPAEAVNSNKQRHMIQAARYYLYVRGYPENTVCRFDVAAILGDKIKIYKDAFWIE